MMFDGELCSVAKTKVLAQHYLSSVNFSRSFHLHFLYIHLSSQCCPSVPSPALCLAPSRAPLPHRLCALLSPSSLPNPGSRPPSPPTLLSLPPASSRPPPLKVRYIYPKRTYPCTSDPRHCGYSIWTLADLSISSTGDVELLAKLEDELKHEKSSDIPEFKEQQEVIQEIIKANEWQVKDVEGEQEVVLSKKFGNEK